MNIANLLQENNLDALLIYNGSSEDVNFFYFTRLIHGGIFEGSYAIITESGVKVITSKLEEETARKGANEVYIYGTKEEREKLLDEILSDAKRIGLNFLSLSVKDFEKIKEILGKREYVDVSDHILELRKIKDEEEIKLIKEACNIASEVARDIPDFLHEGMHEYELAAKVVYEMLRRGAEDIAFTTIAAFGENAAEPHYTSGTRKLKRGDFVLVDFGARYHHYNSDMTRTFVFGRATERQREMYNVVLEAQKIGIEMIREGVNGKDVDIRVKKYIDSTEFKGRMIHSTGHGLGLSVHDHIGLSSQYDMVLKEGMVVTVEPGVYIPGFGGVRIEDDILVKKDGGEVLTFAPKDLIEV